jgi:hypothetical protein
MHARVITLEASPAKLDEAAHHLRQHILPELQQSPEPHSEHLFLPASWALAAAPFGATGTEAQAGDLRTAGRPLTSEGPEGGRERGFHGGKRRKLAKPTTSGGRPSNPWWRRSSTRSAIRWPPVSDPPLPGRLRALTIRSTPSKSASNASSTALRSS